MDENQLSGKILLISPLKLRFVDSWCLVAMSTFLVSRVARNEKQFGGSQIINPILSWD